MYRSLPFKFSAGDPIHTWNFRASNNFVVHFLSTQKLIVTHHSSQTVRASTRAVKNHFATRAWASILLIPLHLMLKSLSLLFLLLLLYLLLSPFQLPAAMGGISSFFVPVRAPVASCIRTCMGLLAAVSQTYIAAGDASRAPCSCGRIYLYLPVRRSSHVSGLGASWLLR